MPCWRFESILSFDLDIDLAKIHRAEQCLSDFEQILYKMDEELSHPAVS